MIVANCGLQEIAAERIGKELGKPVILLDVRPDMTTGEWVMLLRQPVWAVVGTPEFAAMLREFFASVRGIENLNILVFGRDDLASIPDNAPTYVTHAVREQLDGSPMRGRLLPPARTIAPESARDLFNYIVRANLGALRAVVPAVRDRLVKN